MTYGVTINQGNMLLMLSEDPDEAWAAMRDYLVDHPDAHAEVIKIDTSIPIVDWAVRMACHHGFEVGKVEDLP